MSGGGTPQVTIPLRDGAELTVGPEGVRLGERHFPLESIQDARQVSPDPETVALRVAGAGMIEFQPARPGEGAVALEALFRLRPELRPAGFEPAQGLPPAFPAYAPSYGTTGFPPFGAPYPPPPPPYSAPPYAPPGYPPAGYAPAPMPPMSSMPAPYPYGYRASPNAGRAELTPYPRNFGEVLGQIFQLYFKYWGKWLALGVCVSLLPAVAAGAAQVALYLLLGIDPFSGQSTTGQPMTIIRVNSDGTITSPFKLASGDQLLIYAGALAGALVLSTLLSAWQTAALAIGGREALLGQGVPVGRALGGGLRRYVPTLVASVVVTILKLAALAPALACFALALGSLTTDSTSGANLQAAQTGGALSCVALALLIPGVIVWALFTVRLGLAPYAAAADRIGPFAAMRKSWQITQGQFWRVLGVILIVGFVVAIVANTVGLIGVASVAVALLVAAPLVSVATTPLTALAYTTLLYDLRLRREGYSAVVAGTAAQAKTPSAASS